MSSTNPSSYTLTYFNIRGIAEPIRFLLKLAGQEFNDVRLEMGAEWAAKKEDYPWGQLPVLEVDGHLIAQSAAIGRFIAKRHGFAGKDEFESAKCDELVDALKDLSTEVAGWFRAADEEIKATLMKKLKEVHVPKYLSKFDKVIASNGSGWLVGNEVTWADLFIANTAHSVSHLTGTQEDLKSKFINLGKLVDKVFSLPPIALWIQNRPETLF